MTPMPYEVFKTKPYAKRLSLKYDIVSKEDYNAYIAETTEYFQMGAEVADEIASLDGISGNQLEEIVNYLG